MTNWQIKTIREITSLVKDGTHGTHKESPNGIPLLSAKDVNNGKIIFDNNPRLISRSEFDSIHRSYNLTDDDILLTIVGSLGRVAVVCNYTNNYTLQRSVAILRFKDIIHSQFAYYLLCGDSFQKELMKRESKGAQGGVYLGEIVKIKVNLPEKPEQERVVSILETWDNYLELLDKKIALKAQLKKGLMQQLLTGRKRLSGFCDVWLKTKIGEVINISKGRALSSSGISIGNFPVIAGGKTSPYSHGEYTHENVITISASGAYAGYVAYHQNKIWASDCSVISEKKGISNIHYFVNYLHFIQRKIYSYQSGGAQPHIYPKDIAVIKISLPPLLEQKAISDVLNNINLDLKLLHAQKRLYVNQKKYLLKKLITGKIRTPENLTKIGETL
jgi:type I restriction enzyme, S subunit